VRAFTRKGQVYVLERVGLPPVRVWICDVYTLGIADYMAIRAEDPDVDAILTISMWNSYTDRAKQQGLAEGVGVFNTQELMGALHKEGDDLVAYRPREDD
jgi:hypothetical protein